MFPFRSRGRITVVELFGVIGGAVRSAIYGRIFDDVRRNNGSVTTRRPPVRLDCNYMVTAWSNEVEDEHRLLAGATRVLFRNPILPSDVLQGELAGDIEIVTEVAQPESFKDVVDIWSVLDNDLHPSVRVKITIPLDLDVEYTTAAVTGHDIGMADPTWRPGPRRPMRMSGRVERDGQPVTGALVRAGTSSDTTDENGDYSLRSVRPGKQVLFVREGSNFHQFEVDLPEETNITLPGAGGTTEGNGNGNGHGDSTPDSGGGGRRRRQRNRDQE